MFKSYIVTGLMRNSYRWAQSTETALLQTFKKKKKFRQR